MATGALAAGPLRALEALAGTNEPVGALAAATAGYGFAPLRLPADLDFTALFHGVDERVPADALEFGARVMDRFLDQV